MKRAKRLTKGEDTRWNEFFTIVNEHMSGHSEFDMLLWRKTKEQHWLTFRFLDGGFPAMELGVTRLV